jgi:transcription elongation factor
MNSRQVQLNVNVNDITVSGVQDVALPKTEHHRIWEGKRVMITRGALKGYHGLVKTEDPNGVDIELDAKIASQGQARQRFLFGDFQLE